MYKYGISPEELKQARKLIIKDIVNENYVEFPIEYMTLRKYFEIIQGVVFSVCDQNGIVHNQFGKTWYGDLNTQDQRNIELITLAKIWMDGRGLFTEHFNGMTADTKYGDWPNLGQHDQNQWYHEDRLDDPCWFKQCVLHGIGAAGHPIECLIVGNIYPVYEKGECWTIRLNGHRTYPYDMFKAYLFLRRHHVPVYIYGAHVYLTPKQQKMLLRNGYLREHNYHTGYYLTDEQLKELGE